MVDSGSLPVQQMLEGRPQFAQIMPKAHAVSFFPCAKDLRLFGSQPGDLSEVPGERFSFPIDSGGVCPCHRFSAKCQNSISELFPCHYAPGSFTSSRNDANSPKWLSGILRYSTGSIRNFWPQTPRRLDQCLGIGGVGAEDVLGRNFSAILSLACVRHRQGQRGSGLFPHADKIMAAENQNLAACEALTAGFPIRDVLKSALPGSSRVVFPGPAVDAA